MTEDNINENPEAENLNNDPNAETGDSGRSNNENADGNPESRFQEFFTETVETSGPKITDTLMTFLRLKEIDEELNEIEEEKGDLPESIETIKLKVDSLESELNEKKNSFEKIEEEKGMLEQSNASIEEKISKYDEQKYDVRSNKEYDEIVKAIEALFEEVKKNDIRIKAIEGMSGTLQTEIDSLGSRVEELKTERTEKQTLLDELNEQYKQDESALKEKRNLLLSKIDPKSGAMYERINRSYKGEATAIVRKSNCSGCYNSIPPQRVIEIKTAERIFTCQSCGRILISEELIPAE